jgi:alpha-beta hydrolase superfamily lysophospholipase
VNFYSGFSLEGEESLFSEYMIKDDFTVSGFSLGAIEAFLYVLNSKDRIDRLQLFSPAFFQDKDDKFKRVQTLSYKKDQISYEKFFLKNIAYPSSINLDKYFKQDSIISLEKLLNFNWSEADLEKVVNKGVDIEVYLGSEDKIINSKKAHDFFKNFATSYYIKGKGHILNG